MYNYYSSVLDDMIQYVSDYVNLSEWDFTDTYEVDNFADHLRDVCFNEDSITGNASGSYYCNRFKAQEALNGNTDLLVEALEAFGDEPEQYKRALLDPEFADCAIRCYLVSEVANEVAERYADSQL